MKFTCRAWYGINWEYIIIQAREEATVSEQYDIVEGEESQKLAN